AGAARPQPRAFARLDRGAGAPDPGRRGAVGLGGGARGPRSGRLQPLSDPRRARALALRGDLARIEGRAPRADRALPPRAAAMSQGSQLRRSPDAVRRVSAAPLIRGPALSSSSGSRVCSASHPSRMLVSDLRQALTCRNSGTPEFLCAALRPGNGAAAHRPLPLPAYADNAGPW